jgi:uncharacterized membrane protein
MDAKSFKDFTSMYLYFFIFIVSIAIAYGIIQIVKIGQDSKLKKDNENVQDQKALLVYLFTLILLILLFAYFVFFICAS